MPDHQGTLSAAELHQRLERERKHRDKYRGERERLQDRLRKITQKLSRAGKKVKRLGRRYQRAKKREDRGGAQDAVKWAYAQRGVTEKPYGSNWGHPVQDWIVYTGYGSPVPWCGCFVAAAAVREGGADIPTRVRLGYHGHIIEDARARRNGLTAVSVNDAKAGDIVAYDFAHIGLIVGPTQGGQVHTIEGNTSSGVSGSQNNGGGVYERHRPVGDVAVIARPAY